MFSLVLLLIESLIYAKKICCFWKKNILGILWSNDWYLEEVYSSLKVVWYGNILYLGVIYKSLKAVITYQPNFGRNALIRIFIVIIRLRLISYSSFYSDRKSAKYILSDKAEIEFDSVTTYLLSVKCSSIMEDKNY